MIENFIKRYDHVFRYVIANAMTKIRRQTQADLNGKNVPGLERRNYTKAW